MNRFRYVMADVFTDTPLRATRSPSSRTRATSPRKAAADREGDELLGDRVRPTSRRATGTRGSASSRRRSSCRSRAPDARDCVRPQRAALARGDRLETGAGSFRCGSSARTAGSRSGAWSGRCRRSRRSTARSGSSTSSAWSDRSCRSSIRQRRPVRVRLPRAREARWRPFGRTSTACLWSRGVGFNCFAGEGARGRSGCSLQRAASPRIRHRLRGRAVGLHLARHGASASARRSRSRRASRSAVRRALPRVDGSADKWSASRSAARRSSSRGQFEICRLTGSDPVNSSTVGLTPSS